MLLVFRTRLKVSLVQRRYKKSKVKKKTFRLSKSKTTSTNIFQFWRMSHYFKTYYFWEDF